MLSDSSSQEQDGDGSSSDDQEDRGQVTACVNDIEMVSVYNTGKESHVDLLENMGTAPCLVFPVNGHFSDDQHSEISNCNGDKIDLTCFSGLGKRTGRRVYLSPVSKRRRFARCSNDQISQHNFSFSNDDGLEKHKIKPLSTSSKPTVVDVGGIFQTRTLSKFSTKEKPCEQITNVVKPPTNGGSLEKRNVANINEDKPFEGKVDTMAEVHSKVNMNGTKFAREGIQVDEDGAPSISNRDVVPDVLEAAGKPDLTFEMSPRRHGTRNRPPTARALEAVALGLLGVGGAKRKGDLTSLTTSRPPQRARKNKDQVSTSTGSDREIQLIGG